MRTSSQPDYAISTALRVQRLSAGFPTAEAAAIHFRWKVSKYRAHESGTRTVLPADLAIYAEGFGVPSDQLARPQKRRVERMLSELDERSNSIAAQVAARLRCVRILRGHPSARQAARTIGVKQTTFAKHLSGLNTVGPDMIEFYAHAFGISRSWLAAGTLPTGLGEAIDKAIDQVMLRPDEFLSLADKSRVEMVSDDDLLALKPGRPPKHSLKMAEYLWSDVEKACGDLSAIRPLGLITLPATVDEATDRIPMFAIVVDVSSTKIVVHTRLFISTERDLVDGEYLFIHGRRLAVRRMVDGNWSRALTKASLGRVVGRIEPLGTR